MKTAEKRTPNKQQIVAQLKCWLETVVIELNLCPFAKAEYLQNRVRFEVSAADQAEALLAALHDEIRFLQTQPAIETSLLIHPAALQNFDDYNQFLNIADALLLELGVQGEFQIASFHPDYQFANTTADAAENFSNRSPYPLLHILREQSVSRAVDSHPDIDAIPQHNIQKLEQLGAVRLQQMLANCLATD